MSVNDVLSIQLYTLRSLESLDRILDVVAEAGYRRVETVETHLDNAVPLRRKLEARRLSLSSSHVSLAAVRDRPEAVIEACRALGIADLFVPALPRDQRDLPPEGWRSVGLELGRSAERFLREGIGLGYHNHDWELKIKGEGKTALDLLFEAAGDSPLTWQADVAWLARAAADPKPWIDRYRKRLRAAHVKDIAPPGHNLDQDGWADVGSGVLDWRDLWGFCTAAGARWMIVEHDRPADPSQTIRRSFAFLQTIDG